MSTRTRKRQVGILIWCLCVLGMLGLQYVTVAHTDFGPGAPDTNPYPGPIIWTARALSPVTLLPLGPIARDNVWTNGTRWTGKVMRAIPRFHNPRAGYLSFAAANTVFWVLGAAGLVAGYKQVREAVTKLRGRRRDTRTV